MRSSFLAAVGLPPEQRQRAIIVGILVATALRIVFAALATQLLQILGLLLAGGILLLWVCWKMWRELCRANERPREAKLDVDGRQGSLPAASRPKTFAQAVLQIIVADVSMSLDNVLAVAGAAREHVFVLVFGLFGSVVLMGVGANLLAGLLQKQRWIAYVGLAMILYVACDMVYRGAYELKPVVDLLEAKLSW
jgi:YjbE family integral membrane protein